VHTRVITSTSCGRARSLGPAASRQVLPPPQHAAFRAPGGGTLRCTPAFREAFTWDEVFGEDDKEQELELEAWQACAAFPPAQPPDKTVRLTRVPLPLHQVVRLRQELAAGRRRFNVRVSVTCM
jgi:hypothetical protein